VLQLTGEYMNLRGGIERSSKIQFGDKVCLWNLDHRPIMLVTNVDEEKQTATCQWFKTDFGLDGEVFPMELLERVKDAKTTSSTSKYNYIMHGVSLDTIVTDSLKEHISSGQKIHAIKEVRALSGLGLKEAKEFVEGIPYHILYQFKNERAGGNQNGTKTITGVLPF
jgi:ribosomal protein L7/L12